MSALKSEMTGALVASFAKDKQGYGWALFAHSVGLLFGFGMSWWAYQKYDEFDYVFFGIGLLFVYQTYRMATRHKRPIIKIYEQGLWISWPVFFYKIEVFSLGAGREN